MTTINKETMNDQAYNLLRDKIIKQELALGERIDLKNIAAEYNVSIMPVRDALLRLANQGLIINKPRVGYFVRTFSAEEIKEIMEVRRMYEIYCLTEYFDNIDRTELKQNLSLHGNDKEVSLPRNEFDRLDINLHDCIIKAANNGYISSQYNQLLSIFLLFRYLNLDRYQQAYNEHQELLKSIIADDRKMATDILNKHITGVTAGILKNLG